MLAALAVGAWLVVPQPQAPAEEGATEQPEVAWVFPAWNAQQSWGEVEVPPVPAGLSTMAEAGQAGFVSLCASCHGPEGRGDGQFAADLPRLPRDLVSDPLRTRDRAGPVSPEEIYRTLTAGSIAFGMPSFAHLTPHDRWAMTAYVLSIREETGEPGEPLALPPRPESIDTARGETVFSQSCAACHGAEGDGSSAVAKALTDAKGNPCPPANFSLGPEGYRGGATAEDIARSILLGRPSTPMAALNLPGDDLWAVAEHVARLAERGETDRRQRWDAFYTERRRKVQAVQGRVIGEEEGEPRWDPDRSAHFATSPNGQPGCTACHGGIARIASGAMAQALEAFAGGHPDRECAICHEGDPTANTKVDAHAGMIVNPGSLWVTSVGQGCGKCHSNRDVLTSLHGEPLPEARGGSLMEVHSKQTDPSGASGGNHAYRMQRAIMAQESGKAWLAAASTGLNESKPKYTNFALDDPDGPVPCGSEDYQALIAQALESGHILRLEKSEAFPTFEEAEKLLGNKVQAAYADYYRKECSRCHLWGEGQGQRGEYRSAGCSACHVLTGEFGFSRSSDPTIPNDREGHIERHQLVMKTIPEEQCNHCHTRGAMTKHSDAHQQAGIGCVDCHSSIDVHGDGNIYPSIPHQLEIRCEDCHGSHSAAPWELPLGFGSPYEGEGARGTWKGEDGQQHLLTARGNPRTNWLRVGDRVVIESFLDGRRHEAPQLGKEPKAAANPQFPSGDADPKSACTARRADLPGHERLACASCHGSRSLRCVPCHVSYFTNETDRDWLLSGLDYDPQTTRQRVFETPGGVGTRPGQTGVTWGQPDVGEHPSGRLVPHIPGCLVLFSYVDETGVKSMQPFHNPNMDGYPPPARPTLSHELAIPARSCEECHETAEGGGPADLPGDR
jgi:cytochrome c